tara:strand:+ start:103 stop:549 length:447 start_codon:yes stop_codon:yes gene_type:complete
MSQLNEGWASRTQEERDEMTEKDDAQKIIGLVKKYGRSKVDKAADEAKRDRKRRLSNKKITWRDIKNRIENAKDKLRPGEVKTWDKKNNRWVSNKEEDVNEEAPPTEKHERMVKHIKKSYKKDGKLTDQEKSIAYATAWKNYNKEKTT